MLNPSACTRLHLAEFEFIGVLMGIAYRTGFNLPLDLPSLLWKQMLGVEPVVADLEAVDKFCVQVGSLGLLQHCSRLCMCVLESMIVVKTEFMK